MAACMQTTPRYFQENYSTEWHDGSFAQCQAHHLNNYMKTEELLSGSYILPRYKHDHSVGDRGNLLDAMEYCPARVLKRNCALDETKRSYTGVLVCFLQQQQDPPRWVMPSSSHVGAFAVLPHTVVNAGRLQTAFAYVYDSTKGGWVPPVGCEHGLVIGYERVGCAVGEWIGQLNKEIAPTIDIVKTIMDASSWGSTMAHVLWEGRFVLSTYGVVYVVQEPEDASGLVCVSKLEQSKENANVWFLPSNMVQQEQSITSLRVERNKGQQNEVPVGAPSTDEALLTSPVEYHMTSSAASSIEIRACDAYHQLFQGVNSPT